MAVFDDDDGGIRRRIKYYECINKFTDDISLINNVNVFQKIPLPLENITDVQRSAIFYYFFGLTHVLYNGFRLQQPPNIRSGNKIRDFKSFADELLCPMLGNFLPLSEVIIAFNMYFKYFDFTAKEIVKNLVGLPSKYNIVFDKNKQVRGCKGCFVGIALRMDNFERLQNQVSL